MQLTPIQLYKILLKHFGKLNWWPMDRSYHEKNGSDPRFEVIVGAILTQNTAWSNVEKAIENLKLKNIVDIKKIREFDLKNLQELIRPSGFFNQKAKRLKEFASYLESNYNGNLNDFFNKNINDVREELLTINGIGHETADSIILYAGGMPIFVVDAYTKRLCERIPFNTKLTYDEIQNFFQKELSKACKKEELTDIYNELHAQIVNLGKNYCKKKPLCEKCPLKDYCNFKF